MLVIIIIIIIIIITIAITIIIMCRVVLMLELVSIVAIEGNDLGTDPTKLRTVPRTHL